MHQYHTINKKSKLKALISERQYYKTNYCGENFQYPGKIIVRVYGGANKADEEDDDQQEMFFQLMRVYDADLTSILLRV